MLLRVLKYYMVTLGDCISIDLVKKNVESLETDHVRNSSQ